MFNIECVLYGRRINGGEGNIIAVLFLLATSQKVAVSIPEGVFGNFLLT